MLLVLQMTLKRCGEVQLGSAKMQSCESQSMLTRDQSSGTEKVEDISISYLSNIFILIRS